MPFILTNTQNHHRIRFRNTKSNEPENGKTRIKDEYTKRSIVEGPFGIFKEQFQIEKEVVIGMIKTEERINLDALAYNLIRLYNIKQEK